MSVLEVLRDIHRLHPEELYGGSTPYEESDWFNSAFFKHDFYDSEEWNEYKAAQKRLVEATSVVEEIARKVLLPKEFVDVVNDEYSSLTGRNLSRHCATPVILRAFGPDLDGKQLLQIGGEHPGVGISKYLRSKGAAVTNLDIAKYSIDLYAPEDNRVLGDWRDIGEIFEGRKFDVVFTEGMSPVLEDYRKTGEAHHEDVPLDEQEMILKDTLGLLKNRGFLIVNSTDFSCFQPNPLIEQYVCGMQRLRMGGLSILGKPLE